LRSRLDNSQQGHNFNKSAGEPALKPHRVFEEDMMPPTQNAAVTAEVDDLGVAASIRE
jgi:hypothetical protein